MRQRSGNSLMQRMILLNPGPVNLSERVRRAMLAPDLCHREEEFFDLQDEIRRRLLEIYDLDPDRWAAVLLGGSGTAAVEAMITSLAPAPDQGRLLSLENGVYGERMTRIAQIHRIDAQPLNHEWTAPIDCDRLAQILDSDANIKAVTAVHHETTTGRLNDLSTIGALCKERGVNLLLDAVSSFGAEHIDFEGWGVSACAVTSNKCLRSIPGVGVVIIRRDVLADVSRAPRTMYLDLGAWCEAQDRRGTPFTPAVTAFYALRESLRELEDEGGWRARGAGRHELIQLVADGLESMGIKPLLPAGVSSSTLRAWRLPADMEYTELHDGLKQRGFIVYQGQGQLADQIFRIAAMSAITRDDIELLLSSIRDLIGTPA